MIRNTFLLLTLLAFVVTAVEVKHFRLSTATTTVAAGESIWVQASLATNKNAKFDAPQFVKSTQYQITGSTQNQSSSSSISIINGKQKMERTITTQLRYLVYFPTKGQVTLPALNLSINGETVTSNSITFNVGEAPKVEAPVAVRYIRDRSTVYRGEQLRLTVRIQQRLNTNAALTNEGYSQFLNALQIQLSNSFNLTPLSDRPSNEQTLINGVPYLVYDFTFNLVPLDTGSVSIKPLPFSYAEQQTNQRRSNDPFESFFGFSTVQNIQKRIYAPRLSYTIKPLPSAPRAYTGIIGSVALKGSLSTDTIPAGEGLTLKISLSGRMKPTALGEVSLPKLPDCEIFTPEKRITQDTTARGVYSRKQYTWMLIPQKEGEFHIPTISVVWFDPVTGTYKTEKVGPYTVHVIPGSGEKLNTRRYLTQETIATIGDDIRYIKTNLDNNDQPPFIYKSRKVLLVFFIPWMISLFLVGYKIKQRFFPENLRLSTRKRAYTRAAATLIAIGKKKQTDSPVTVFERYIASKSGANVGALRREELESLLVTHHVQPAIAKQLTEYLNTVEMARYLPTKEAQEHITAGIHLLKTIEKEFRS